MSTRFKIDACIRIESCLITSINDSFLGHKRLSHISMDIIYTLVKNELVKDLSHIAF